MEDFHSKRTGQKIEDLLDQIENGGAGGGGITSETDPIFSASPAASITEEKKTEWDNKVDKVDGKQLSTEDFTTALKNKLNSLNNYDDTEINEAINTLRSDFNTLVSGDTTTAIKSFNDIIAFLNGIEDSESLDSIIASIQQQIAGTYTKPSGGIPKTDLASDVQTSLDKADTALQEEAYKGTIEAVDTNESVEDPELEYATTQYVDQAIANAITNTLNTPV